MSLLRKEQALRKRAREKKTHAAAAADFDCSGTHERMHTHTDFSLDDDDDMMTTTKTSVESALAFLERIAIAQERQADALEQQAAAAAEAPTWSQANVLAFAALLVSLLTLFWPNRTWGWDIWNFWAPGSAAAAAKSKAKREARAKRAAEKELDEEEKRERETRDEIVVPGQQQEELPVAGPAPVWEERMRPRPGARARAGRARGGRARGDG